MAGRGPRGAGSRRSLRGEASLTSARSRARSRAAPQLPQPGAAGAAARSPRSLPALGVTFVPGPAALPGFSGIQRSAVNEIRSPQITERCRTL